MRGEVAPQPAESIMRLSNPRVAQRDAAGNDEGVMASPLVSHEIVRAREGGTPLSGSVRKAAEQVLGQDLGQVCTQAGPGPSRLNRELDSHAVANGGHIF